jgi:uncharacterized protein (DUF934 family)
MSEPAPAAPRLWTPDGFRDDAWSHAQEFDALASNGRTIVPLQVFLALDPDLRRSAAGRIGVLLAPAEPIDALLPWLDTLPLVALAFPAFNDGRSFSKAELLRGRHGFCGALRATGQVLVDQLPHMLRVGFDEFEVSSPVLIRRLEEGRIGGIPYYNQPAAAEADRDGGYSWRRRPSRRAAAKA